MNIQMHFKGAGFWSDEPDIESVIFINDMSPFTTCFTPDGKYQIHGSWDNNSKLTFVDIRKVADKPPDSNFEAIFPKSISVVKITADGNTVAAGGSWENTSQASYIYLFNMSSRQIESALEISHQYFEISPDGRFIAAINNRSFSGIYWSSNGTLYEKFDSSYGLLKFSPDGKYLAAFSSSGKGYVDFLKFPEMTLVLSFDGKPNFKLSPNREGLIQWSPDNQYLALIITSENEVKIIDTSTFKTVNELTTAAKNFYFNFVSFSPEGGLLALGGVTIEDSDVSLGLHLYDTSDWTKIYDEPKQIDYKDEFRKYNSNHDRYGFYDYIYWYSENSLYLSVTMYKGSLEISLNDDTDSEDPEVLLENQEFNYPLIVGTGVSVIIILSILSIFTYLGFFPNPLYSKLKPDEVKNQITRNSILSYINTNPGCKFSDIRRSMKSSSSNVYYHLAVLEREDLVFSKVSGVKKMYYSTNYPKISKMFPAAPQLSIHEKIYQLLLEHPGLTQKEIAANLNISEATVSRYIIDLMTENFLRREREGKLWKCYANQEMADQ